MSNIRFEWDPNKYRLNQKAHKVSFEEAKTVFWDEDALRISDADHADEEDRFILLGMSSIMRILTVVHCYREDDDVIRIISARKADRKERDQYTGRKRT